MRHDDTFGALEYDLVHYCNGKDLRDFLSKPRKMTMRQVIVYLRHLPKDSATSKKMTSVGEFRPSYSDLLGISAVNELRMLNYLTYTKPIPGYEKVEADRPKMIPFPGEVEHE